MAAGNLDKSLKSIFGHEGGFSIDSRDPGNWTGGRVGRGTLKGTKYGIAANSYPGLDIRNLTLKQATEIYRQDYAAKVRFDDLPAGIDHATLDYAINSGVSRAAKELQRIVGATVDGWIGPKTVAAAKRKNAATVINTLCDERLAFLKRLSTWKTYGKGWSNRVASVRSFALKLAK